MISVADGDRAGAGTPSVRWALAGLSLTMLMPSLDTSIANVGLPTLTRIFGASFPAVQWIVLAYLLAITTLIVGAGRLGDIVGRRRLLLAGIGLFTLASLLCGLAPTLPLLVAARALQGLGAAVMMALTVALVRETVPKDRTGSAMGLLGTMSAIGTTLGPSLGGIMIAGIGWRSIFLVNLPLGILAFVLAQRTLPADPKRTERPRFDLAGTLLLAGTLAAYALAMTSDFGPPALALLAAAAIGAGLFGLVEARVASPLIRPAMLRDRRLGGSLAMGLLVAAVMMTTLVVGPFYLSRALGLDEARVGLVMSIGPALSMLGGVVAGRIVDRLGAPAMVVAGLGLMVLGAAGLAVLPGLFGVAGYIAAIMVLTPGYQLFQAANSTAVMVDVGPERRGVVAGLLSLSRNLGLVTGAAVMGAVFAAATGTADLAAARPEAIGAGLRVTFAVAAGAVLVALAIALAGRACAAR